MNEAQFFVFIFRVPMKVNEFSIAPGIYSPAQFERIQMNAHIQKDTVNTHIQV